MRSVLFATLFASSLALLTLLTRDADAKKRRVVVVEEEDAEEEPHRIITATVAPLHLIGPYFEGMVEARVSSDFGVAVIGGGGRNLPFRSGESATFWNVGGQLRYYAMGSFDGGMEVGAEVMWLHAPKTVDATTTAANLAVSPFVGWKWVTSAGFTLDSQIGLSVVAVRQQPEDAAGKPLDRAGKQVQLFTTFNLGWSF